MKVNIFYLPTAVCFWAISKFLNFFDVCVIAREDLDIMEQCIKDFEKKISQLENMLKSLNIEI